MYSDIAKKKFNNDFQRGFNPLYPINAHVNPATGNHEYELRLHVVDSDKAIESFDLLRKIFETSLEEDRDKIRRVMELLR